MDEGEEYTDDLWQSDYVSDDDAGEAVDGLFSSQGRNRGGHGLRNALIIVLVLAILAGIGVFAYSKGRHWLAAQGAADYPGPGAVDVRVVIPPGAQPKTQAAILFQADVVASEKAFQNAVTNDPATFEKIQAGTHKLKTKMSAVGALAALADPANIVLEQFTIPEGLRATQVLDRIAKATGIPVGDLQAVAKDPSSLGLPDWDTNKQLEGFLYPNTYAYDKQSTATTLLKSMVGQFNSQMAALDFVNQAKAAGRSPMDVLTMASIVQMEGNATDMPDIAQVFWNRLAIGMPLQSDATVAYANNLNGAVVTSDDQRNLDSPYNTYKVTGLPPGPITNPGKEALQAALSPSQGDYLYFVTVNPVTGETKFGKTKAEHDQYVSEFQAWCNDPANFKDGKSQCTEGS